MAKSFTPKSGGAGEARMPGHYQVGFDLLRVLSFNAILLGHITLLLGHHFASTSPAGAVLKRLFPFTSYGTMVFFALGSFYLCRALLSGEGAWPAVMRRLQRVYPPYLLITLLYTALLLFVPWSNKMPVGFTSKAVYIAANLVMASPWIGMMPIVTVGWAISVVAQVYVVIGVSYDWLKMREWPRVWRVGVWLLVGVALRWYGLGLVEEPIVDFARMSALAVGGIAAELWAPLGTWPRRASERSPSVRALLQIQRAIDFVLGDWPRKFLELAAVKSIVRFGARRAYHTLLTQGLALHSLQVFYPFGESPGLGDLAAIYAFALLISYAAGWVLSECEEKTCRTVARMWKQLRPETADPIGERGTTKRAA